MPLEPSIMIVLEWRCKWWHGFYNCHDDHNMFIVEAACLIFAGKAGSLPWKEMHESYEETIFIALRPRACIIKLIMAVINSVT